VRRLGVVVSWGEVPWGAAVTFAGMVAVIVLLAMDERNRRKFLTREEAEGMSKRFDANLSAKRAGIERNAGLFVALDDRVGDLEEKVGKIEERQTQQWERISQQMGHTADTIREVTKELKDISRMQQEHALRLERITRTGGN
jgi:hypothetical protein